MSGRLTETDRSRLAAAMARYNALLTAATAGLPLALPLALLSKKRRRTVPGRLGIASPPRRIRRMAPRPVWVHALSVGEVISAAPLVTALRERRPEIPVVFSASTATGIETARRALAGRLSGIFLFPYDLVPVVDRILGAISPRLVVIVETDIWPNFLWRADRRRIPVTLVNGRLSDRSVAGYLRFKGLFGPVISLFSGICAQSPEDGRRFRRLGADPGRVTVTGSIKFDQPLPELADGRRSALKRSIGAPPGAPVVVAGSTHEGEEALLSAALVRLRERFPDLFLAVVPRNPDRGGAVSDLFGRAGFRLPRLSDLEGSADRPSADGVVVDRIGRLKALYALSDVAFVGGSLVPFGGHNPLEPAAWAKPVLFGPHMGAFREIAALLLAEGGAVQVGGPTSAAERITAFLEEPEAARRTGERALGVLLDNRGAVARTLEVLAEWI